MNAQRALFVRMYLTEAQGNGTKAAILAKYSERTAAQCASRLLKDVEIRAAIDKITEKADTSTAKALERISRIANREPAAFTGADVIKANELILKVNGALKDKHSDSRIITVNIGFLTQAPTATAITATTEPADDIDGEVLSLQPPGVNSGEA